MTEVGDEQGRRRLVLVAARWAATSLARCGAASLLVIAACGPEVEDRPSTPDASAGGGDVGGGGGFDAGGRKPTFSCKQDADCVVVLAPPPCQRARCFVGTCATTPALDGDACDDGDLCSESDRCLGGSCQPGALRSCDDGNPCTADGCVASSGACTIAHAEGGCATGAPCELGVCGGGVCVGQPALGALALAAAPARLVVGASRVLWLEAIDLAAEATPTQRLALTTLAGAVVAELPLEGTRLVAAAAEGDGFVVAGSDGPLSGATLGARRGVWLRVGVDGAIAAAGALPAPGGGVFSAVALRSDGARVLVGQRRLHGSGVAEGWLVVVAADGAPKLDFYYAGPTEVGLLDVQLHGQALLNAGWQRNAAGDADRPLLVHAATDGAVIAVAQPSLQGRALRVLRRPDGVIALLIAAPLAGQAADALLLLDASLQPLATVVLAAPSDLATVPGLVLPAGVSGPLALRVRDLGLSAGAGSWLVAARLGAVAPPAPSPGAFPSGAALLLRLSAHGATQGMRALPAIEGAAAMAVRGDVVWLAGAATEVQADGATPAGRLLRVDAFGHQSCQEAGACAAAAAACDDGDPCTLDGCAAATGCSHAAAAAGVACGVGQICGAGGCGPP